MQAVCAARSAGMPQADAAAAVEEHDLLRVPGEVHPVLDLQHRLRRNGRVQQLLAGPERNNLGDAVVLDVVHGRFAGPG